jgi:hypothetical protein
VEFWGNMRRCALYTLTVSTGLAYTVLQPIVEMLKNPVTTLLIVAVIAGSGFLVSQVLNAMVGNSEFIGSRKQQTCGADSVPADDGSDIDVHVTVVFKIHQSIAMLDKLIQLL